MNKEQINTIISDIELSLRDDFAKEEQIALSNQQKVLYAFRKNQIALTN